MTEPAADRRDRYAAALLGPDAAGSLDSAADELIDAVMAVADAELAAVLPPADRAAAYAQGIRAAIAELKRDALGVLPRLEAMAAEAQSTTQPDRCPHGCDTSTCPCLACEDDEPERLCGRTESVDGETCPPCARPSGHEEAYCRSADSSAYFLAAGARQDGAQQ